MARYQKRQPHKLSFHTISNGPTTISSAKCTMWVITLWNESYYCNLRLKSRPLRELMMCFV